MCQACGKRTFCREVYHATSRGNARSDIVLDDIDRPTFLRSGEEFLKRLFPLLRENTGFQEAPRIQRPPLREIMTKAENRAHRNAAIVRACLEFGYSQAEVAAATGLHYSTISKIMRKA